LMSTCGYAKFKTWTLEKKLHSSYYCIPWYGNGSLMQLARAVTFPWAVDLSRGPNLMHSQFWSSPKPWNDRCMLYSSGQKWLIDNK
jgi:hypothetical protein